MGDRRRSRSLSEWEGKRLLAEHEVAILNGRLARTIEDARSAAAAIGFPVALKAVGADIVHKTEIGALQLNLADAGVVEAAARALFEISGTLLVEAMITDAVAELIVGVELDPAFGPCFVIGSGGILVELVGDSRLLLMPATRAEIAEAIGSLKVAKLLGGYRGKPAGDLDAAIDATLAIQSFAIANLHRLTELDVNPLMVRPSGKGAVAADVLIRLIEETPDD